LIDPQDVNITTSNILNSITTIVDRHAPIKQLSKRKQKNREKPWLTKGILHSIKIKQKLYKNHILDPSNPEKKEKYKRYSNILNNMIKNLKRQYLISQIEINKTNLKTTWKLIGNLIKRKTKSQVCPVKIIFNNHEFTDKKDIADQLNNFFSNVGSELAQKLGQTDGDDITRFIQNLPGTDFVLKPVTINEVRQRLETIDTHKSSPDIPYYLIKIASNGLAEPIAFIVNGSIIHGIVPDLFKVSCITPIFKHGDTTNPSCYRPISILPSFNKILERIVYDQIISFLDHHKILTNYQFGFRKNHSTEQAILEITDKLRKSIDDKEITCGLFLDFSKAFDTVDHQILLKKLFQYGIKGKAHDWFISYLTNRKQQVRIDNVESDLRPIYYGVPLLFLIYINALPNVSFKLNFRMFVDDTNIFFSHRDPAVVESIMSSELQHVLNYCKAHNLTVNLEKTHYVIIRASR